MADDRQSRCCLILFAKVPAAGFVKTRLCPPLTPERAAEIYQAMQNDVMRGVDHAFIERNVQRLAILMPPGPPPAEPPQPSAGDPPLRRTTSGATRLGSFCLQASRQHGADLGERLADAFERAFADGLGPVVVRNTDSPLLPWARVAAAFDALAHPAIDCVLGPDHGGGYYLVGLKRSEPRLFRDLVAWPPAEVFARSVERARALGLSTLVLPAEADVDTPADLAALARDLRAAPERAPLTAAVLERWRPQRVMPSES
jgi:glycosyltransferase A (GT-A) superfamily protein (DUF2064 family)